MHTTVTKLDRSVQALDEAQDTIMQLIDSRFDQLSAIDAAVVLMKERTQVH